MTRKKKAKSRVFQRIFRTDWNLLKSAAAQISPGLQGKREQGQGLILYLWENKMVKAICQTDTVCQTSAWSKCAQEGALLTNDACLSYCLCPSSIV